MRYDYSLTVTAGKTEGAPEEAVAVLSKGIITSVEVVYPPGPAGLVRTAILFYESRLYPTNPDGSFIGDDTMHVIRGRFPLLERPYQVTLLGWAPDATLDHTVYFGFEVEEPPSEVIEAVAPVALPEGF